MYLKRKIDDFLIKWKEDVNHKPLIVKGARQIGKTESIMHFANANYASVIYINFALDKKFIKIAEDGYDVNTIVKNISLINPSFKFVQGHTIIVFDEIQEYPDIATALKSFRIDGRYDIICSGSMLGINYRKIHSNSVGNKVDYEMFSMDFEEFLWAKGYDNTQIYDILEHMTALKPFGETELSVYKSLFLDYCVLGGMPDVVKGYVETGTFQASSDIQNQIRLDYEEDVRKYAQGLDQTKIISVYRSIPAQLAKENKKFQYSQISKNARSREYMGCIEWLIDAGVVTECNCLLMPELPLKGNVDTTKYMGLTADRIQKYENGARKPKFDMLKQFAYVLGVETIALMDPVVSNYIGAMFAFFEMEELYELEVKKDGAKYSLQFGNGFTGTMNDYLKEWYEERETIRTRMENATEEEKASILKEYHEWEKTFPKALCDRTKKSLQKARLKNTIAELQEKLDAMDDE